MKLYSYAVKMKIGDFKEGNLEGTMVGLDENDAKRKIRALVSEQLGITLTVIDVSVDIFNHSGGHSSTAESATAVSASSGPGSSVGSSSKP